MGTSLAEGICERPVLLLISRWLEPSRAVIPGPDGVDIVTSCLESTTPQLHGVRRFGFELFLPRPSQRDYQPISPNETNVTRG